MPAVACTLLLAVVTLVEGGALLDCYNEKVMQIQAFSRAAEGIRTLDLLHGKQSLWSLFGADTACKNEVFRVGGSFCDSTAFTASSREFGHRMGTRAGCPSTVMLSPEQAAGRVARYRSHAIAEQTPYLRGRPLRPLRARHRRGRRFPARAGEAGHPVCAPTGEALARPAPVRRRRRACGGTPTPRLGTSAHVGSTTR
jgi:hypothetical protein